MKKILWILLLGGLWNGSQAQTQTLLRKGFIGVQTAPIADSITQKLQYKEKKGVWVQQVLPQSTAEKLGIKPQDILLTINQTLIESPQDIGMVAQTIREGNAISMSVWRKKKVIQLKGAVIARPLEKFEHSTAQYDQVAFKGGFLRMILNKPKINQAKYPTIFFIQGYTCGSVDNLSPTGIYHPMIESFARKGYAVVRVEKPGVGDCLNTPDCAQIDFPTELTAFETAYQQLKQYDFIDQQNIFIFGHSMGGVAAPLLAEKFQPKGVVVYGTLYEPWFEFELQMFRFQNALLYKDYVANERDMRLYHTLSYELYVLKKTPMELAKNPEFKRLLIRDWGFDGSEMLAGRHYTYWQSIHDLELAKAWSKTESHVLTLYGEIDFEVFEPTAHQKIAEIVNHYHPGKGSFRQIKGTDHLFLKLGTMENYLKIRESGKMRDYYATHVNLDIFEVIDEWIKKIR